LCVVEQFKLTWKQYAPLLEGPFANSILESPFFKKEYNRLLASSRRRQTSNVDATAAGVAAGVAAGAAAGAAEDPRQALELLGKLQDRMEQALELLGKLQDRMEENRRKFPRKTLFSSVDNRLVASSRRRQTSNVDATAAGAAEDPRQTLELLGKLKDRMEENRRKFPWKTLFSSVDLNRYRNRSEDFV
jgi:hypothetical protein